MQKEAPLTPKSRRINRPAPVTPDRPYSTSAESLMVPRVRVHGHRATMAPGDFTAPAPGLFGKKRLLSARQSIMPTCQTQTFLETTRKPEPENKDLEMKLLYDKCLQTIAVELLMKKKAEDNERAMISQLGMLAKEEDALDEKLRSMTAKERDLKNLMELQNGLDTNFSEITASLEEFEKKPVEILLQLKSMLESLDTLKCKNIVKPETPEDMKKIHELFAKCSSILQSINDCIGNKRDTICTVNQELKNFTRAHSDIQDYAKKAEEALCSLQVVVLKDVARSVSRNEL